MYNFLTIMLQAQAQGQSTWSFWIMMILIFVVMWLFMIRPQRKKQQELEQQRKQMQVGDKVVTAGGIHGKIEKVQEETMMVEIAKGVSIKIDKSSVFIDQVQDKPASKAEKKAGAADETVSETAPTAQLSEEEKAAKQKEEKNAQIKKYVVYGVIIVVLAIAMWLGGVFGKSPLKKDAPVAVPADTTLIAPADTLATDSIAVTALPTDSLKD